MKINAGILWALQGWWLPFSLLTWGDAFTELPRLPLAIIFRAVGAVVLRRQLAQLIITPWIRNSQKPS